MSSNHHHLSSDSNAGGMYTPRTKQAVSEVEHRSNPRHRVFDERRNGDAPSPPTTGSPTATTLFPGSSSPEIMTNKNDNRNSHRFAVKRSDSDSSISSSMTPENGSMMNNNNNNSDDMRQTSPTSNTNNNIIAEITSWDVEERHPNVFIDVIVQLLHFARYRNWKKKALTVVLMVCSCLVFFDLVFLGNIHEALKKVLLWMGDHEVGAVFVFILIFIFSTLIFIPPVLLVFGAGFVFGEVCGMVAGIIAATAASFIGSSLGALIAFFRARYMMRDLVKLFAHRYAIVGALDRAVKRNGFRVLVLLRLCALIPFNGLNYICGITGVGWEDFTLSLVGVIPTQLVWALMGATANNIMVTHNTDTDRDKELLHIILICAGLAFAIIGIIYTGIRAKRELEKELESEDVENVSDDYLDIGIEADYQEGQDDEEWFWVWA